MPSWKAIGPVVALGLARHRASAHPDLLRASSPGRRARAPALVTYLVPAIALVYGAIFLDEQITGCDGRGLALILAGVALGHGPLRLPAPRRGGCAVTP